MPTDVDIFNTATRPVNLAPGDQAHLGNFATQWYLAMIVALLQNTATAGLGTVTVATPHGALTAASGSITLGGTSQQLAAANSSRTFFIFQNISDEDLWVRIGAAAAADTPASFKVYPGGSLAFDGNYVPTAAIHVVGATTGSKFTAYQA